MATYLYIVKATLRHSEDNSGRITKLAKLTAKDYVEAMRAGPGFGTESHDLRGNLVPLDRYLAKQAGPPEDLYLYTKVGTPYALAIFGAGETGRSKMADDLKNNAAWQALGWVRSKRPLRGLFAEGKFGTPHKKFLFILAPDDFGGFPSDASPISASSMGMITDRPTLAKARSIDLYLS